MDFDVVVSGSGAGGSTIAYALAKAGKRVLVVERGFPLKDRTAFQNEHRMLIRREAQDDRAIQLNGRSDRLYVGGIPGGGTALYGGALLRPAKEDFTPGDWYADHVPDHLHQWPLSYDELEPWYTEAENLFRVSGDHKAEIPHLGKRAIPYPGTLPELEPINQRIKPELECHGISPFHLPLAINFATCLRCPTCPGYYCPNGSRGNAAQLALDPAVEDFGATFWSGWEAEKLIRKPNGAKTIQSLQVRNRSTGARVQVSAQTFIISQGAVWSPVLLMNSGLGQTSDELGRNYMYHAGALVVGVFPKETGAADRFSKQFGWTDDYFGTPEFPHKLGYVQTLPVPGPLTLQNEAPFPVPFPLAEKVYERTLAFAATVEDLPRPENRVSLDRTNRVSLNHQFHEYDSFRMKFVKKRLTRLMRHCGAMLTVGVTGEKDDIHTAHQVGTCRFGDNPKTSVLDRCCRVHDTDNVFVVDGSFMPTSLGVGPALTIIANALRVADHLTK